MSHVLFYQLSLSLGKRAPETSTVRLAPPHKDANEAIRLASSFAAIAAIKYSGRSSGYAHAAFDLPGPI